MGTWTLNGIVLWAKVDFYNLWKIKAMGWLHNVQRYYWSERLHYRATMANNHWGKSVCEEYLASPAADWDKNSALTGLIINCLLIGNTCNAAGCYNNLS